MKNVLLLGLILCSSLFSIAQNQEEEKPFGIKFSGFVKNDFFHDSRQTAAAREGHFLLWPSAINMDANGVDINGKSNFNFLSIQSRVKGEISGPDAFGAKTSGLIEVDFLSQANDNVNLIRMRHAFLKLKWEKAELLMGQYWNPFFVTDCFPGTVSFNTGAPIHPLARNPQIRFTYSIKKIRIIAVAQSQRDFVSRGIASDFTSTASGSEYLRNSGVPDMHLQLHYAFTKGNLKLNLGAGAAYKMILPTLTTSASYANTEKVSSLSFIYYTKLQTKPITWKIEAIYGENLADILSIGGFAATELLDPVTQLMAYQPTKTFSAWTDLHNNGKILQFGLFAGYSKNLGIEAETLLSNVYGFGTNIDHLLRVSPRIIYNVAKTRFAFEVEYTKAAFGTNDLTNHGLVTNTTEADNLRFLLSTYFFF